MNPRKSRKRSSPAPQPEAESRLTENQREVGLLQHDTDQLIVEYGRMIEIIVWNAIRRGLFPPGEDKELIQAVTVRFLELIPTIRRGYNGRSLLRTYVSAILVNVLNRMAREQKRPEKSLATREPRADDPALELPDHDIQVYVRRLGRIMHLFADLRPKLLVILKCYYRISLGLDEVFSWYPECDPFSRDHLIALSQKGTGELGRGGLFLALAPIVSKVERRRVSADTLRKWTDHRIREIIHLLNGDPPRSSFDRRTLGDLFERLSKTPGERTI